MASPLQFAYRTQKAIGVFDAAPVYAPLPGFVKPEGNLRCCIYSPCGRYFAWASNEGVSVVDASNGQVLASLPLSAVFELGFSPRGTFIATWERPSKDEAGDATKNLKIWRTIEPSTDEAAKQPLGQFVQKSQNGWNLQYTADEQYCARLVTNEVQFYDSNDLKTVWNKLRVEGVTDFALAPGSTHNLAVFVPERKVSNISLPPGWSFPFVFPGVSCVLADSQTTATGPTRCCQSFQRAPVCEPHLAEDLFQGRQGSAEVEPAGLQLDRAGPDRR